VLRHLARARPQAAPHLVLDARPHRGLALGQRALAQRKDGVDVAQGLPGRLRGRVGPKEQHVGLLVTLAHDLGHRPSFVEVDLDADIGLVVSEHHVVTGPELLDEVVLKDQRFLLLKKVHQNA